jgi:hypothetical protein
MGKPRKGLKYLYECDECHVRMFISYLEVNRAARPRCTGCGSARLDLVSDDARDDRARLNRERLKGTGGSLKLSDTCETNDIHRAVR